MSVYVTFDKSPGEPLASNRGWSDVGDWLGTVGSEAYPALSTLWEYGAYEPCSAVLDELTKAAAEPPADETVSSTLMGLADSIRTYGDPSAAVFVTGGVGKGDVEEDEPADMPDAPE